MSRQTKWLPQAISDYLVSQGGIPDDIQADLIAQTSELGGPASMQIAPEQGKLLTLLVQATGARRALELGTFTGYSALAIARGLPPDGLLLCCDVSKEWTAIARGFWERAGVADRINLVLGPALKTLQGLSRGEPFDFAFIDADKENYEAYYEELVGLVRPGGLILADNVLWSGRVVEMGDQSPDTLAIRRFNQRVLEDERVDSVMLPIADGLTMAVVK